MVVKEEQERVRALLADTITLLCRNGLTYKSEFNISALIGITLDKEDVLLVDIRETIKNNIEEENAAESSAESEEESPPSKRQRKRRKRKRSQNSNEEISLADKQFEPVNLKTELSEQDEDDIVFIKDEPGDSLDSSMDNSHHYKGQLQQQSFMSHYGNMSGTIAMPGTVNMSWDQSSQQQQQQQNQSLLANASASNISTAAQSDATTSAADQGHGGHETSTPTDTTPKKAIAAILDSVCSGAKHVEGVGVQCPNCLKFFSNIPCMRRHFRERHLYQYNRKCPICNKGYNRADKLGAHLIREHHFTSPFKCSRCTERIFTRNDILRAHVLNDHKGDDEVSGPLQPSDVMSAVNSVIDAAMSFVGTASVGMETLGIPSAISEDSFDTSMTDTTDNNKRGIRTLETATMSTYPPNLNPSTENVTTTSESATLRIITPMASITSTDSFATTTNTDSVNNEANDETASMSTSTSDSYAALVAAQIVKSVKENK